MLELVHWIAERKCPVGKSKGSFVDTTDDETHLGQHLARSPAELSVTDIEWAFLRINESFARWLHTVMSAVSSTGLAHQEQLILHVVRMQNQPRGSAQIAQTLNRTDINNIQYSLKKLETAGLVFRTREAGSKTYLFAVTADGAKITDAYAALRRRLLIPQIELLGDFEQQMTQVARVLSVLIGIYEEQARAAGTFDRNDVAAMVAQR
jgi:predicted MarR family transcription regulator